MRSIVTRMVDRVRRTSGDRSLADRRFVVHGDGRLVTAVERILSGRGAEVHLVPGAEKAEKELAKSLDKGASCVLALDERHEKNLRAAVVVSEANEKRRKSSKPEIPVVVRAFDPKLADEIEREPDGEDARFRIRGALSVAHMAAPDFVVAALVDEGEENLVTLRLGDQYVNVCRIRVCAAGDAKRRSRPLLGKTPAKLLEKDGCQVLARRRLPDGAWSEPGDAPLEAGEEVLLGGQLLEVLSLVRRQSAGGPSAPPHRTARVSGRRRDLARALQWKLRRAMASAGTPSMLFLIVLFAVVTLVVAFAPGDSPSHKVYLWVLTALGSPPLDPKDAQASPVLGAVGLLAGGLALGLGISMMSAHLAARRTIETNRRQARRLRNHVVVVGFGDVGLRISQLLENLGVACAVVNTDMSPETERRTGHIPRVPVVEADLEAGLRDARIDRAFSLIATSEDNLLNVEACLRAKRERGAHVRTIARIFDDVVAEYGKDAFGVDDQISAAEVAARAFVDAAVDEHCLRPIEAAGWPMAALRWPEGHPVGERQMRRWHNKGIRVLAVWQRGDDEAARPDPESPELRDEHAAILVGPKLAMADVLHELRGRTAPRPLAAAA